jgi:hypothetical protein
MEEDVRQHATHLACARAASGWYLCARGAHLRIAGLVLGETRARRLIAAAPEAATLFWFCSACRRSGVPGGLSKHLTRGVTHDANVMAEANKLWLSATVRLACAAPSALAMVPRTPPFSPAPPLERAPASALTQRASAGHAAARAAASGRRASASTAAASCWRARGRRRSRGADALCRGCSAARPGAADAARRAPRRRAPGAGVDRAASGVAGARVPGRDRGQPRSRCCAARVAALAVAAARRAPAGGAVTLCTSRSRSRSFSWCSAA